MMKFIRRLEDQGIVVIHKIEAENLEDVIQQFEEFLRGCGYYFDGKLQIVDEDDA